MKYQCEKMAEHLWRQVHQNTKYYKRKYGLYLDIERPKGGFYQTKGLQLKCNNCGRTIEMGITSYYKKKSIKCYSCNNGRMKVLF